MFAHYQSSLYHDFHSSIDGTTVFHCLACCTCGMRRFQIRESEQVWSHGRPIIWYIRRGLGPLPSRPLQMECGRSRSGQWSLILVLLLHCSHTHTHTRAHARTHARARARTHARTNARTYARTHAYAISAFLPRAQSVFSPRSDTELKGAIGEYLEQSAKGDCPNSPLQPPIAEKREHEVVFGAGIQELVTLFTSLSV